MESSHFYGVGDLVPPADSTRWKTWVPRESVSPEFQRLSKDGVWYLQIASSNTRCFGKWVCDIPKIQGYRTYNISGEYRTEGCDLQNTGISILITWITAKGIFITRDYVDIAKEQRGGLCSLSRVLTAPEDAECVRIELMAKWVDGTVIWTPPHMVEIDNKQPRMVKLATTCIRGCRDHMHENLVEMLGIIDAAGSRQPDIVCISETVCERLSKKVYCSSTYPSLKNRSQPIPGNLTTVIAERARRYGCYIAFTMNEVSGDFYYVTCVLMDRSGNIVGKYRKVHLPLIEAEEGISPGDAYPVFDTDFGRIGLMICWDHWFPEPARILCRRGAELLVVSTIGNAPLQSVARALDNGIHVVVAGQDGPKPSRIINPFGEILAEADFDNPVAIAEVDLNKGFYQDWLSVGPAYGEAKSVYKRDLRPGTYMDITKP